MTENEFILADRIQKIQSTFTQYGIENFYIAYSGGKDSSVLSEIIDLAVPDNKIPRVYMNTGIELNAVREFVEEKAKTDFRIHIIKPEVNIKEYLEKNGYPFKSKNHAKKVSTYQRSGMTLSVRKYISGDSSHFGCPKVLLYQFTPENKLKISHWCCYGMKEVPLDRYTKKLGIPYAITGMRKAEGGQRLKTKCLTFSQKKLIKFNPLFTCSNDWMDWMIQEYNIKLPIMYYPPYNFPRTGCKGCPFALNLQEELDVLKKYFPNEYKQCELIWAPVYAEYRRLGYRLKPTQMTIDDWFDENKEGEK